MKTITRWKAGENRFAYTQKVDGEHEEISEVDALAEASATPPTAEIIDSINIDEHKGFFDKNERLWIACELNCMNRELRIAQRKGHSTVAIDAYAEELRGWPDHADFPDESKRPSLA